jgi:hypothetical protein
MKKNIVIGSEPEYRPTVHVYASTWITFYDHFIFCGRRRILIALYVKSENKANPVMLIASIEGK